MSRIHRFARRSGLLAAFLTAATSNAAADERSAGDLAAAAQNSVANMISLPLQNNTLFGIGPGNDTANVLNVQPVIPVNIGDWNLINRTIAPLIYLPDVTRGLESLPQGIEGGSEFGLQDINHSVYVSPARQGYRRPRPVADPADGDRPQARLGEVERRPGRRRAGHA